MSLLLLHLHKNSLKVTEVESCPVRDSPGQLINLHLCLAIICIICVVIVPMEGSHLDLLYKRLPVINML